MKDQVIIIKETPLDKFAKIAQIIIALGVIGSLTYSFSTYDYLRNPKIELLPYPEDIIRDFNSEFHLNNPNSNFPKIELIVKNTGGVDTGKIDLNSMEEGIFRQSYTASISNIESGKNNHTKIQFEFNDKNLRGLKQFPCFAELPIRVRCENCKETYTEYIKICLYDESSGGKCHYNNYENIPLCG